MIGGPACDMGNCLARGITEVEAGLGRAAVDQVEHGGRVDPHDGNGCHVPSQRFMAFDELAQSGRDTDRQNMNREGRVGEQLHGARQFAKNSRIGDAVELVEDEDEFSLPMFGERFHDIARSNDDRRICRG